jgi:hypothetical protein
MKCNSNPPDCYFQDLEFRAGFLDSFGGMMFCWLFLSLKNVTQHSKLLYFSNGGQFQRQRRHNKVNIQHAEQVQCSLYTLQTCIFKFSAIASDMFWETSSLHINVRRLEKGIYYLLILLLCDHINYRTNRVYRYYGRSVLLYPGTELWGTLSSHYAAQVEY